MNIHHFFERLPLPSTVLHHPNVHVCWYDEELSAMKQCERRRMTEVHCFDAGGYILGEEETCSKNDR